MAKYSAAFRKKLPLMLLVFFSMSTATLFFIRLASDSCNNNNSSNYRVDDSDKQMHLPPQVGGVPNPLDFMKSKLVLLVSHELSLSGTYWLISSFLCFAFCFFLCNYFIKCKCESRGGFRIFHWGPNNFMKTITFWWNLFMWKFGKCRENFNTWLVSSTITVTRVLRQEW